MSTRHTLVGTMHLSCLHHWEGALTNMCTLNPMCMLSSMKFFPEIVTCTKSCPISTTLLYSHRAPLPPSKVGSQIRSLQNDSCNSYDAAQNWICMCNISLDKPCSHSCTLSAFFFFNFLSVGDKNWEKKSSWIFQVYSTKQNSTDHRSMLNKWNIMKQ